MKKAEIASQEDETLRRREEEAKSKERADAKALKRYQDAINFPVYNSMTELQLILSSSHSSGVAKYSDAMKCEIVVKQMQHRRDCYGRSLKPGALWSDHKGGASHKLIKLLAAFADVLNEEQVTPSLLQPPQIREVYQAHPFASDLRRNLDQVITFPPFQVRPLTFPPFMITFLSRLGMM